MKTITTFFAFVFLMLGCWPQAGHALDFGSAEPFKSGDIVCFLGDSITKGGQSSAFLSLFYATRFPDRAIRFYNCGVGGDRAAAIMDVAAYRLKADVLAHKPTVVSVMLGMNDVNLRSYEPPATPALDAEKQAALDTYAEAMPRIFKTLQDGGARLILCRPSIFEENAKYPNAEKLQHATCAGVNAAIGKCADLATGWSRKYHTGLVNYYDVMNAINNREQAKDPAFSIVGHGVSWPEWIHPGAVGHFVMMYAYLKAQGIPADVAKIAVDAGSVRAGELVNCSVEHLQAVNGGVEFDCLEHSLPMVPPKAALDALKLVPFTEELNREVLTVHGLGRGRYECKIDGSSVGVFSSDELRAGVNLSENALTPQYRQAADAAVIAEARRRIGEDLRELATVKYGMAKRGIDIADPAAVKKAIDEMVAQATRNGGQVPGYLRVCVEMVEAPGKRELEYEALGAKLLEQCQPKRHRFAIIQRLE